MGLSGVYVVARTDQELGTLTCLDGASVEEQWGQPGAGSWQGVLVRGHDADVNTLATAVAAETNFDVLLAAFEDGIDTAVVVGLNRSGQDWSTVLHAVAVEDDIDEMFADLAEAAGLPAPGSEDGITAAIEQAITWATEAGAHPHPEGLAAAIPGDAPTAQDRFLALATALGVWPA
jgi:hypothetical protein